MTATTAAIGPAARAARTARRLWLLVALVVVLALVGAGVGAFLLTRPPDQEPPAIGSPVRTSFGTFTVTGADTTFVPDTQGPPSAVQHNGARGSDQLQVWVRLANSRGERAVAYSPSQFRLVGDTSQPRRPDGSTLTPATLATGASIDGQVWFDLTRGHRPTGSQWLEYVDPGGRAIRVPLGQAPPAPARHAPGPAGEGHSHSG